MILNQNHLIISVLENQKIVIIMKDRLKVMHTLLQNQNILLDGLNRQRLGTSGQDYGLNQEIDFNGHQHQ